MKRYILFFLLILTGSAAVSQRTIYFPSNVSEPDEASKAVLQSIADSVREYDATKITIKGYTDNRGGDSANYLLSKKRADAVSSFLTGAGIDATIISVFYEGASHPAATNKTAEGMQQNRRVEITYKLKDEEKLSDINLLYEKLADKGISFCIDPSKDTALVAPQGTIIMIPAHTFKTTGNCPCIKVVFHEYFTIQDIVLNNLTTTSNGYPMVSAGMIKMEAYCDGKTVAFNSNDSVTIMVPAAKPDRDMKVFTADRAQQKDILNWQTPGQGGGAPGTAAAAVFTPGDVHGFSDWYGDSTDVTKYKCPLFFCKVKRYFDNLFYEQRMKKMEKANEEREVQIKAVQKEMDRVGILEKQLGRALKIADVENTKSLSFYVFKSGSFSYHNLDKLLSGGRFAPFYVNEKFNKDKDVRAILKDSKSVMPAVQYNSKYEIKFLFADMSMYVIGLKYKDGKIYLAKTETNTNKGSCSLNFKEVSEKELRAVLQLMK